MATKPLNFSRLDEGANTLAGNESAQRRWTSREPDPTVQMSIRMHASVYDKFRLLCKKERRTNGEMLEILVQAYKST
jgi:hypothetical protein